MVGFEIRVPNTVYFERLAPKPIIRGPVIRGFNLAGLKMGEVKIYFAIALKFFQFELIRPSFPEHIFRFPGPK